MQNNIQELQQSESSVMPGNNIDVQKTDLHIISNTKNIISNTKDIISNNTVTKSGPLITILMSTLLRIIDHDKGTKLLEHIADELHDMQNNKKNTPCDQDNEDITDEPHTIDVNSTLKSRKFCYGTFLDYCNKQTFSIDDEFTVTFPHNTKVGKTTKDAIAYIEKLSSTKPIFSNFYVKVIKYSNNNGIEARLKICGPIVK